MPQRREMKNNISQSLDLESFLLLQEEKEKKIFRLSRFNSYLAFFFCSVASESPSSIFSQTHFRSKGPSLCCEDKCWLKGMFEDKFRGTIFHILTGMEEPSGTKTKAGWTYIDLHGSCQSSYIMVLSS